MPDTRPGMQFDERGICQMCIAEENKDKINWDARFDELKRLCDKYRGMNGDWFDTFLYEMDSSLVLHNNHSHQFPWKNTYFHYKNPGDRMFPRALLSQYVVNKLFHNH